LTELTLSRILKTTQVIICPTLASRLTGQYGCAAQFFREILAHVYALSDTIDSPS
jgi:hypothetical protein